MKCVIGLSLTAFVGFSALTAPASAGDAYHFCNWYARTAINQSYAARAVPSCRHLVWEQPNRWTLDWSAHYGWCLSAFGSGANVSENQIRVSELNYCES